jgi:hypothetical protein
MKIIQLFLFETKNKKNAKYQKKTKKTLGWFICFLNPGFFPNLLSGGEGHRQLSPPPREGRVATQALCRPPRAYHAGTVSTPCGGEDLDFQWSNRGFFRAMLRIRITLMRIRIQLFTLMRTRVWIQHFILLWIRIPAPPLKSYGNLRPPVY